MQQRGPAWLSEIGAGLANDEGRLGRVMRLLRLGRGKHGNIQGGYRRTAGKGDDDVKRIVGRAHKEDERAS